MLDERGAAVAHGEQDEAQSDCHELVGNVELLAVPGRQPLEAPGAGNRPKRGKASIGAANSTA
eukprot:5589364-Lingulodinium_polyedra.AAC.1